MIENKRQEPYLGFHVENLPIEFTGLFGCLPEIPDFLIGIMTRGNICALEEIQLNYIYEGKAAGKIFGGVIYDENTNASYFVERNSSNSNSLTLYNIYDFVSFVYYGGVVPAPLEIRRDVSSFFGWTNLSFTPAYNGHPFNFDNGTSACEILDSVAGYEERPVYTQQSVPASELVGVFDE